MNPKKSSCSILIAEKYKTARSARPGVQPLWTRREPAVQRSEGVARLAEAPFADLRAEEIVPDVVLPRRASSFAITRPLGSAAGMHVHMYARVWSPPTSTP